jgi:hypothetical protein
MGLQWHCQLCNRMLSGDNGIVEGAIELWGWRSDGGDVAIGWGRFCELRLILWSLRESCRFLEAIIDWVNLAASLSGWE